MDPVERAIERVKGQRKILADEVEECKLLISTTYDRADIQEFKGTIKRNKVAIEGLSYALTFLENTKEEPCPD